MFRVYIHCLLLIRLAGSGAAHAQGHTIIRDAEIERTLKSWTAPVMRAAGLDPNAVRLILVQSPDVNAFVAGGQTSFLYLSFATIDKLVGDKINENF